MDDPHKKGENPYPDEKAYSSERRFRNVVFTINNYDGTEIDKIRSWKLIKYFTVGRELGKKRGTPHLQGYAEFGSQVLLSTLKNKISKKMICFERRGTPIQAANYCKKDGDFEEDGDMSEQGVRTDWDKLRDMARTGATMADFAEKYPKYVIQNSRGLQVLIDTYRLRDGTAKYSLESCCARVGHEPLDLDGTTHVVVGPPGLGKTQWAKAHFDNCLLVSHMDDLKAFDVTKYDGIVFDDMDFRNMPRTTQIHVTDWEEDRSIHARHYCSWIPKETRKIICANEYPFIDDGAIDRRVTRTHF